MSRMISVHSVRRFTAEFNPEYVCINIADDCSHDVNIHMGAGANRELIEAAVEALNAALRAPKKLEAA